MVGILIRPEEKTTLKNPQLLNNLVQINSSKRAEALCKDSLSLSNSKLLWQQKLFFLSLHGPFFETEEAH